MTAPTGAARLRDLLAAGGTVVAPGVFDPFTARLIEDLGFPALYLGGNALGIHLAVGQPFTTLTETADAAQRIARVTDAPLVVDAGGGFGDAPHVVRTIRELERAGVAALHIDDQPYPKRAGYHRGRGGILPVRDAAEKLRVAVESRRDPDLVVIARTDALRVGGSTDAVLERCHAYADAGVDMLMVLDLTPERCAELAGDLPRIPLAWIGAVSDPGPPVDELGAAGFRLATYPFNTIAAVVDAMTRTWGPLRETGRLGQNTDVIARARSRVLEVTRMAASWDIEDRLEGIRTEAAPGPRAR